MSLCRGLWSESALCNRLVSCSRYSFITSPTLQGFVQLLNKIKGFSDVHCWCAGISLILEPKHNISYLNARSMSKKGFWTLGMIECTMSDTAPWCSYRQAPTIKKITRSVSILCSFIYNLQKKINNISVVK